tara:strand:- start:457 stop:1353 length:897 start_codon:yes stop_codon:yes gene_type:complete
MEDNNSPNKQLSLQNAQNFMNYNVPSFMNQGMGTQGGGAGAGTQAPGGIMSNLSQAQGNMRYNVPNLTGAAGGGGGGAAGLLGGVSSFLGSAAMPIGIGLSIAGSVIGAVSARKQERKAARQAKKAKKELKEQESIYKNLDVSNPYMNMENTMEDLTINQKQFDLERQQAQQSQANILDSLRGAAGGSGVAALAQTLAREGQIGAQARAARIGDQERQNQLAERQEASRIQGLKIQGEMDKRAAIKERSETFFGMAQQKYASAKQAQAEARQAKMDAITGGIGNIAGMLGMPGQGQSA